MRDSSKLLHLASTNGSETDEITIGDIDNMPQESLLIHTSLPVTRDRKRKKHFWYECQDENVSSDSL